MKIKSIPVLLAIALILPLQDVSASNLSDIFANFSNRAVATDLNATVKYVITGESVWYQVVSEGRMVVTQNDRPADATITMSAEDFQNMMSGRLNAMEAFMAGRIRVDGDINTIMRMQSLLVQ